MLRHFHSKLGISRSTSVENLHKSGFKVSPKLFPLHLMLKTPKVGPMIHEISQVAPRGPDFLVLALQAFHLLQILLLGSAICSASKSVHQFAPVTSVACFDNMLWCSQILILSESIFCKLLLSILIISISISLLFHISLNNAQDRYCNQYFSKCLSIFSRGPKSLQIVGARTSCHHHIVHVM